MSNISQKDLGKVILEDISAQTVSRCEMRCGASLIASSLNYFDLMKTRVLDERNLGFSLCFYAYRQDATNGRRKVCALELDHAYLSNLGDDEARVLRWEHFHRLKRLGDLMPVGDESGLGCLGITLRGLHSLACPSWRDLKSTQGTQTQCLFFIRLCIFETYLSNILAIFPCFSFLWS